jgi:hypothetical protein
MVLPAPGEIHGAAQHVDYKLYPENSPEMVQQLHDSLQSIAYRLESLELAGERISSQSSEFPEEVVHVGKQARETIQLIFERWASLEADDVFEQQRGSLEQQSRELEEQLAVLDTDQNRDPVSDRLRAALYTMLGSWRGLIDAMANAQTVINRINWHQWATARF